MQANIGETVLMQMRALAFKKHPAVVRFNCWIFIKVNPLSARLKLISISACLRPDILTITRNMHKLSLQNYATVLPHQRGSKCCKPPPSTTPIWLQACVLDRLSKFSLKERTAIH